MTYVFFSWNVYLSQISGLSWGFILLGFSSHQIYMVPFVSQGACQTWLNYSPPLILRNRKSARCSFVKMSVLPSSIYRFNKPSMSLTRHQRILRSAWRHESRVASASWKAQRAEDLGYRPPGVSCFSRHALHTGDRKTLCLRDVLLPTASLWWLEATHTQIQRRVPVPALMLQWRSTWEAWLLVQKPSFWRIWELPSLLRNEAFLLCQ